MNVLGRCFLMVCVSTVICLAQEMAFVPDVYSSHAGSFLTISKEDGWKLSISVVGANFHSCTFEGPIEGHVATDGECIVKIWQISKDSVETEVDDPLCNCGARVAGMLANSWGTSYRKCNTKETNQVFLKLYKGKKYGEASEVLKSYLNRCQKHMDIVDQDAMYNDLAISLYREGKKSECLNVVKNTFFATTLIDLDNYEAEFTPELNETFEPAKEYYFQYKQLGPAIYYNYKLCR